MQEQITLGKWTEGSLGVLLREASGISGAGNRIAFLSRHFLKTAYGESTLMGDAEHPEVFVINLETVDCFTFIDYVEAMRRSGAYTEFRENLRKVRYRSGTVAYEKRNHFFTDWRECNAGMIEDVTGKIGYGNSHTVVKQLNRKSDGTYFLPGIPVVKREVTFIHSDAVDEDVIENLSTGDYIGMYAKVEGLDVSHTGIIIREEGRVKLRHASSLQKHRRVIDEDVSKYIKAVPGIVVLRPGEISPPPRHGSIPV